MIVFAHVPSAITTWKKIVSKLNASTCCKTSEHSIIMDGFEGFEHKT
jgi:hypothetical protein